jgi:hypothetical protein
MIAGNLVDVAFPDLLQLLHMSGRSGTLYFERGTEKAFISFHHGRIASAWCPTSISVARVLEERGRVSSGDLAKARAIHDSDTEGRTLGQVLLSIAAVRRDDLRDAVARKIEHTVYELISWRRGTFKFVVEEVRFDEELTFAPRDIVPQVDLDTQVVLMEALRLADSAGPESRPSLTMMARRATAAVPIPQRIDVATGDATLFQALGPVLEQLATVRPAPWSEAGMLEGEAAAVVIADVRGDARAVQRIVELLKERPELPVVAIADRPETTRAAYTVGAVAVTPADPAAVVACCAGVMKLAGGPARATADAVLFTRVTRLRELQQDIRAGLASTKLSVNVMALFASIAERGILFAVRRETLVALTAYGRAADGSRLADVTRGLSLVLESDGPFAVSFQSGASVPLDWDRDQIPDAVAAIAGRPAAGHGLMVPVIGARRSIAVIYTDNGTRPDPIQDVPILELACGLFGLAIENEILRRQVER